MTAMQSGIFGPSNLDLYVDYVNGRYRNGEQLDNDEFVARLLRQQTPSPNMLAGTLVHRLIEHSKCGTILRSRRIDGWHIRFLHDADLPLPESREIRVGRCLDGLSINGRVDAIGGNIVHDIKTTGRPDLERYARSWQWRAYLWMTGYDHFIYHLLPARVDVRKRRITLYGYHSFRLCRYPALDSEVECLYREFIALVRQMREDGWFG